MKVKTLMEMDRQEAVDIMKCVASGLLFREPKMTPQDLVNVLFLAMIKLEVGMSELAGTHPCYILRNTKAEVKDQIIIDTVDSCPTEFRMMVKDAAVLVYKEKLQRTDMSEN